MERKTSLEEKYLARKIADIDSWVTSVAGAYYMSGTSGWKYQTETHREIMTHIEKIVRQVYKHAQKD